MVARLYLGRNYARSSRFQRGEMWLFKLQQSGLQNWRRTPAAGSPSVLGGLCRLRGFRMAIFQAGHLFDIRGL
jgi:hypothetical protein